MREIMADMVHQTQDTICNALEQIDGVTCREDTWERAEGGGGRSRVFSGGKVFEKAGVNVSVVHGTLSPQAAKSMGADKNLEEKTSTFTQLHQPRSSPPQPHGSNRARQLPLL